jgi:hypothetical protein
VHCPLAAGQRERQQAGEPDAPLGSTSTQAMGSSACSSRRACSGSKAGSSLRRHRKKRLRVASSNSGAANSGWRRRGRPQPASIAITAAKAPPSTAISKVTGMNIGQLCRGRPAMSTG